MADPARRNFSHPPHHGTPSTGSLDEHGGSGESDDDAISSTISSDVEDPTPVHSKHKHDATPSPSVVSSSSRSSDTSEQVGRKKKEPLATTARGKKEFGTDYLDPDLYGLRRSSRAVRKIIDSEDDTNSHSDNTDEEDEYVDRVNADDQDSELSADRPSDDDDEDDDDWGGKKKKKRSFNKQPARSKQQPKKKLKRRRNNSDDDDDWPADLNGEVRFSTRNRSAKSYREDEDDGDESEEDENDFLSDEEGDYMEIVQPIEEGDVVDQVMDHRYIREQTAENNLQEDNEEEDEEELTLELYIKWKNWSHLHNTWERFDNLRHLKGFKKCENYMKLRYLSPTRSSLLPNYDDDFDDAEQKKQNLEEYVTVERVISSRPSSNSDEQEYLCKWKSLSYADCTWETAETISSHGFQAQIDEFLNREQSTTVPHRSSKYSSVQARQKQAKRLTKQPEYIVEGLLREYQLEGISWLAYCWSTNTNGILADEMGLGKTVQTISFIRYMFHDLNIYGPHIVVVPLSVLSNWYNEFCTWAPEINVVVYIGNSDSRQMIREHEFYFSGTQRLKINVLLTTFEIVMKDCNFLGSIRWSYMAVDEAHRLKNSESQLHDVLKEFSTSNRLLITGTPLQNTVKELWSLLNFLHPETYQDLEEFEEPYKQIMDAGENAAQKVQELQSKLKPHLLRRMKKDVEKSLPQKNEYILRIELARDQLELYKNIHCRNFDALRSGGNQVSLLNIVVELKKACNHPYLINGADQYYDDPTDQLNGLIRSCGKMYLLDKLLQHLHSNGHRVLIFSQMVRLLDILSEYLRLRGYAYQRLDGSVGSEARKRAIEHFNAPNSNDFVFLLSTRAGGLGINLNTADSVIIYDSSYNPQDDLQAVGRAHRIGQKNTVNIYRFITKDSIEEEIFERAKSKMVLEHAIIGNLDATGVKNTKKKNALGKLPVDKEELDKILKFGAANLFKKVDEEKEKDMQKLESLDITEFLKNAERQEEQTEGGSTNEQFLNQFKVADFGNWEDVITESERQKFLAENEKKMAKEIGYIRKRTEVKSYAEEMEEQQRQLTELKKKRKPPTKRRAPGDGAFNDKSIRALVKFIMKFGNPSHRVKDLSEDSDLADKPPELVNEFAQNLMTVARKGVQEADSDSRKSVMVSFEGVGNINATSLVARYDDLALVHKNMSTLASPLAFRFTSRLKPVSNWDCQWGVKDDAMLLLGIYRHGFGNWKKIESDDTLGLAGKFFLGSGKDGDEDDKASSAGAGLPKVIHLVRRAEYLLKTFREEHESKASKKPKSSAGSRQPGSLQSQTKTESPKKPKQRASNEKLSVSSPKFDYGSIFKDVKNELASLREEKNNKDIKAVLGVIKTAVVPIGLNIEKALLSTQKGSEEEIKLERRLWKYVKAHWPFENATWEKIKEAYQKIASKSSAAPTPSKGSTDQLRQDSYTSLASSSTPISTEKPYSIPKKEDKSSSFTSSHNHHYSSSTSSRHHDRYSSRSHYSPPSHKKRNRSRSRSPSRSRSKQYHNGDHDRHRDYRDK